MEEPYTKREQDEWRKDVRESLERIEEQTKKTNGSVADVNRWRERANGGFAVAGAFMAFVIIPILGWSLYVLWNLPQTLDESIDKALSAYDVNLK